MNTESHGIANAEKSEALENLAKTLIKEMEGLDPTEDWDPFISADENWARLDEGRKTFYRLCVEALLTREDWVRAALRG